MRDETKKSGLRTTLLILLRQEVRYAAVFHQLWTERDPRVPVHRRMDALGHPTLDEIAAHIAGERSVEGPGLLSVQRRDSENVIGYCGLVFDGNGDPKEPELAFEFLQAVHNRGFATEAARAVLAWTARAGYARAWASVWEWNAASRRVLEKLAFVDSGRDGGPSSQYGRNVLTVRELLN